MPRRSLRTLALRHRESHRAAVLDRPGVLLCSVPLLVGAAARVCTATSALQLPRATSSASSRRSRCSSSRAASRSPDAEDVALPDRRRPDAARLLPQGRRGRARGVILFGLEFGSNRWACVPYCEHLRRRPATTSSPSSRATRATATAQPGYEPLQWVTDYEVERLPGGPRLPEEPARRRPARHRLLRHQQGGQRRPAGRRATTRTSAAASPTASSPPTRRWCRTCGSGSASTTATTRCRADRRRGTTAIVGRIGLRRIERRAQLPLPAPGDGDARGWRRGRC